MDKEKMKLHYFYYDEGDELTCPICKKENLRIYSFEVENEEEYQKLEDKFGEDTGNWFICKDCFFKCQFLKWLESPIKIYLDDETIKEIFLNIKERLKEIREEVEEKKGKKSSP